MMIFQAKYEFTKELTNIVIDLNCLKALEKILLDNSMQYQICVEYKNGDTLYDLAIHDIEEDLSKDKRQIDSLNVNANNDEIGFELNVGNCLIEQIKIRSNDKTSFLRLKQEIQEWLILYKNKNPFVCFAPFSKKSELIRIFSSFVLSCLTILPMIITEILHNKTIKAWDCIMVCCFFLILYYFFILALSAIFLKKVEIDVGINHTKTRRNFGYFILTVVLIPVILTWIFSFV